MTTVYKHAHLLIKSSLICQLFFIFITAVNMQLYLGVHFLGNSKMLPSNQDLVGTYIEPHLVSFPPVFFLLGQAWWYCTTHLVHHPVFTQSGWISWHIDSTPFIYAQPYHKWTSVLWWSLTVVRQYLKLLQIANCPGTSHLLLQSEKHNSSPWNLTEWVSIDRVLAHTPISK